MLEELRAHANACWAATLMFYQNRDAHGIHDMGVEIQAIDRAIAALRKVAQ